MMLKVEGGNMCHLSIQLIMTDCLTLKIFLLMYFIVLMMKLECQDLAYVYPQCRLGLMLYPQVTIPV